MYFVPVHNTSLTTPQDADRISLAKTLKGLIIDDRGHRLST